MIQPNIMRDRERERQTGREKTRERERERESKKDELQPEFFRSWLLHRLASQLPNVASKIRCDQKDKIHGSRTIAPAVLELHVQLDLPRDLRPSAHTHTYSQQWLPSRSLISWADQPMK